MGLLNMLTTAGTPLSINNGATPSINPGATKQSKLHADGILPSYSMNGANVRDVRAAYVAYNDGYNNSLPQPSQLDLNGAIPSQYLNNLPQ
jgi:hypothetical protein